MFASAAAQGEPIICLLVQEHDQSVDPNLVKLADAYDIASSKLKDLSEQTSGPVSSTQRLNSRGGHLQACWRTFLLFNSIKWCLPAP